MENLGEKIREGLYKKRMKQIELARKIGKTPQQVTDWIKGRSKPQVEDFLKIAKELDIIEEFFPEYKKQPNGLESRVENIEFYLQEIGKKLNIPGINIHQTNNHSSTGVIVILEMLKNRF